MSENLLPLLVAELLDVDAELARLESRREALRASILEELRREALGGVDLPAASVRVQTYSSIKGLKASAVLPVAAERGWVDEALSVNGRALHRLASPTPPLLEAFRALGEETHVESLVVRRRR